jgi:hypothetical protein
LTDHPGNPLKPGNIDEEVSGGLGVSIESCLIFGGERFSGIGGLDDFGIEA